MRNPCQLKIGAPGAGQEPWCDYWQKPMNCLANNMLDFS
jgi:hypothetical protein